MTNDITTTSDIPYPITEWGNGIIDLLFSCCHNFDDRAFVKADQTSLLLFLLCMFLDIWTQYRGERNRDGGGRRGVLILKMNRDGMREPILSLRQ